MVRKTPANKRASAARGARPPPLSKNFYSKLPILKPRYLTEDLLPKDKYLVFWELLDKQYLRGLLFVKERYYPRLMATIATTLRIQDNLDKNDYGEFAMVFWLAGVKYASDSECVQQTLQVASVARGKYLVGRMTTDHRLLHYVLTYMLLPRKGNHGTLSEEDLIILWAMVKELELSWPYLIGYHLMSYTIGQVDLVLSGFTSPVRLV
ncbi:hypothetical protein PIB30_079711 [Stylosanthes scabra]|uniref:Uncharacterized protein n=1 Tax=Stylosanthes scabra TaxID=79078 RepID=A0ABU6WTZ1_9FABA|nr:hypothetical protein [Stylosanthes scabra]